MSEEKLAHCSFCEKSQKEVRKIIHGPSVLICDECVDLCNDILLEEGELEIFGDNSDGLCNEETINVQQVISKFIPDSSTDLSTISSTWFLRQYRLSQRKIAEEKTGH